MDALYITDTVLPLGPLCWAAVGKDPGFTPLSLLELLKRRGKFQEVDFKRLKLNRDIDIKELKLSWLNKIEEAESFISSRDPKEVGCLYYSKIKKTFIDPTTQVKDSYVLHYGKPGGVVPKVTD